MFLCLFLEIPLFYCLKTIENNRKSIGTIDFEFFCTQSKSITILCLLTKFGVISMTTVHFINDSMFFEIYWKYIGFADFKVPTFTKTSIFLNRCFFTLKLHRKKRQIGYTKKWESFMDLANSVLSYSKSNNRGGHYAPHVR